MWRNYLRFPLGSAMLSLAALIAAPALAQQSESQEGNDESNQNRTESRAEDQDSSSEDRSSNRRSQSDQTRSNERDRNREDRNRQDTQRSRDDRDNGESQESRNRRDQRERDRQYRQRNAERTDTLGDSDFGLTFETQQNGRVHVRNVDEQSIASELGIRASDNLVRIGDQAIRSATDFRTAMQRARNSNRRVPVVVERNGREQTIYFDAENFRSSQARNRRASRNQNDLDWGADFRRDDQDRLIVSELDNRGLADAIGLRRGDVLDAVDGDRIREQGQIRQFLRDILRSDRDRIPMTVLRDGNRRQIFLRRNELERFYDAQRRDWERDRFNGYADDSGEAWLGVALDPRYDDYAVVRRVYRDSAADRAGLEEGDWIVRINGQRIRSPRHLSQMVDRMNPGENIDVQVARRVSRTLQARLGGQDQRRFDAQTRRSTTRYGSDRSERRYDNDRYRDQDDRYEDRRDDRRNREDEAIYRDRRDNDDGFRVQVDDDGFRFGVGDQVYDSRQGFLDRDESLSEQREDVRENSRAFGDE